MPSAIIPALLTKQKEELETMIKICRKFCSYVQIDVMDGEFVPSLSVAPFDLNNLAEKIDNELHLMVEDPYLWLEPALKSQTKKVIFHLEAPCRPKDFINQVKEKGLRVGIAINPKTSLEQLLGVAADVDSVLFMTVEPGFYGAPFIPAVLEKIKEFRRHFPKKEIGVDGGIKLSNLKMVFNSGVNYVCVGSAIMKDNVPAQAYKKFQAELSLFHA